MLPMVDHPKSLISSREPAASTSAFDLLLDRAVSRSRKITQIGWNFVCWILWIALLLCAFGRLDWSPALAALFPDRIAALIRWWRDAKGT